MAVMTAGPDEARAEEMLADYYTGTRCRAWLKDQIIAALSEARDQGARDQTATLAKLLDDEGEARGAVLVRRASTASSSTVGAIAPLQEAEAAVVKAAMHWWSVSGNEVQAAWAMGDCGDACERLFDAYARAATQEPKT